MAPQGTVLSPAERLAQMSDTELSNVLKMIDDKAKAGDAVVNPGTNIGTATSRSGADGRHALALKGSDAFNPDLNQNGNFAYFQGYLDPSERMNPDKRDALLRKSLQDVGYSGKQAFKSFGSFLKDGFANHQTGDFRKRHMSSFDGIPADFFRARGMNTINGEDGGFLVTPEFATTIESLFFENDLPTKIDTMPISGTNFRWPRARDTNRADGSRHAGAIGYWIDEGNTITESKLKLGFADMRMKKLCVVVFMTSELMNDNDYAVEQWVRTAVREEANFQVARAIMLGGGGVEPTGYAKLNTTACVTVAKTSGQAADTITTANLLKMESQLFTRAGSTPLWLSHVSTTTEIGALSVGNFPVNINIMQGGITQAPTSQLRGLPNIKTEFCSTLGDAGDIQLIDPKMYKGIRRSVVREDVSMHVEFLSDQNALRFIFGFDGRPLYDEPITPYQAGSTAPPQQASFLKLAERA